MENDEIEEKLSKFIREGSKLDSVIESFENSIQEGRESEITGLRKYGNAFIDFHRVIRKINADIIESRLDLLIYSINISRISGLITKEDEKYLFSRLGKKTKLEPGSKYRPAGKGSGNRKERMKRFLNVWKGHQKMRRDMETLLERLEKSMENKEWKKTAANAHELLKHAVSYSLGAKAGVLQTSMLVHGQTGELTQEEYKSIREKMHGEWEKTKGQLYLPTKASAKDIPEFVEGYKPRVKRVSFFIREWYKYRKLYGLMLRNLGAIYESNNNRKWKKMFRELHKSCKYLCRNVVEIMGQLGIIGIKISALDRDIEEKEEKELLEKFEHWIRLSYQ